MSYDCGTISAYIHRRCRCDDCRQAMATYRREWEAGPPRMVDITPLIPRLREAYRQGATIGQLARRVRMQHQSLSKILTGRKTTARAVTAARLASLIRERVTV